MAVSPVDGTVLTVGDDGRPRQWDPGTGRLVRTFVGGHAAPARAVAVSADGKWALSGGEDKLVRLWDVATGREIRRFGPHPWSVVGVAFGPPGRALAASGNLTLWDLESGTRAGLRTYQPPRGTTWVAYSEPAGRAAFCDQSDVHVHLWDPAAWKPIRDLEVAATGAGVVAFSPDGRWLASGRVDGWLRLWDVTTGDTRWTTHAHTQETVDVAFSPDGRWVVSAGGDRTVRVWEAETGRVMRRYRVPTDNVTRAAFLPDGTRIVSTHRDHMVRVWRVQE
jgi:WD40 repeat protein